MFSNACFFRLAEGFTLPPLDALEAALEKGRFVPCGPTQPESFGWTAPRGAKHKQLAEIVDGHLFVRLCGERRAVPASAVKAAVEERVEKYKQETGIERVPAKLKKEFKEEVLLDLLPRAFTKRTTTMLWINPAARLLVVDAGSLGGADKIVSALLAALLEIPGQVAPDLQLIRTQASPAASMAHWLATREAPWRFTVDRDCELKAPDEQKSTVRYARHTLDIDEVAQHIAAGKVPTQLSMTWNDRVSFTLTEGGTMRKLKMLDVVLKESEDGRDKESDQFDANAVILTSELSELIPDLLLALGGEEQATFCEHCGGNDETPQDHTMDCTRPQAAAPAATGDEQYDRAVKIVLQNQKASISLVQRHLQIGYIRAATLLEEMEKRGIVSAMNAQGARTILSAAGDAA